MNKKSNRFTGQPEIWFNHDKNVLVVRQNKYHCDYINLDPKNKKMWQFTVFKEMGTFDFYDGSKYLKKKGFELITRV